MNINLNKKHVFILGCLVAFFHQVEAYKVKINTGRFHKKDLTYEVKDDTIVLDLKNYIKETTGIDIEKQKLLYMGKVMGNEKTLNSCGLNDPLSPRVISLWVEDFSKKESGEFSKFNVAIKTPSEKTVICQISDKTTIEELKKQITKETGLDQEQQRLIFQGEVLDDKKEASVYGLTKGSIIHLAERIVKTESLSKKLFSLNIRNAATRKITKLKIDGGVTIKDLKIKIGKELQILPHQQELIASKDLTAENKSLDDYNIDETFYINVNCINKKTVTVVTSEGLIKYSFDDKTTVGELKFKVADKTEDDAQVGKKLSISGSKVECSDDNEKLVKYGVRDGDTLVLE